MSIDDEIYQSHTQEVRRGSVVIATLKMLAEPQYGYALIDMLNKAGIDAEANTLYPLLRRMEKLGLLESLWNTDESRPRKYYKTTSKGDELRIALLAEWNRVTDALNDLNGENS